MLARQVEVELLELVCLSPNPECATLADDLDGGTQVLELGPFRHVGNRKLQVGGGYHLEDAVNHIDGRLSGAGGALDVGGTAVQSRPVQGTLGFSGQLGCPLGIPCLPSILSKGH